LRLRFNAFDAVILVFILVVVALLLRTEFRHAPSNVAPTISTPNRTVEFTVVSLPTQYAASIMSHLQVGGEIYIQASGNYVPLGTLKSVGVRPYTYSVNDGTGTMVLATDPQEKLLQMTVGARAVVSGKTLSINGTPYYVDQHAAFREGGAQFEGVITNEQVH